MKAQLDFIALIAIIVFALVIGLGVVTGFWQDLLTSSGYQSLLNATPVQHTINNGVTNGLSALDTSIIVIFIASALVSIVLAAASEANILLGFLGLVCLIPDLILAFIFHDTFFALLQNSFFAGVFGAPVIYLFQYFPAICLGIWFIEMVATFAK